MKFRIIVITLSVILLMTGCAIPLIYTYHEPLTEGIFLTSMQDIGWDTEEIVDVSNIADFLSNVYGNYLKGYIASKEDVTLYYLEAEDSDTTIYTYKKWEDKITTITDNYTTISDDTYSSIEGTSDDNYYYFMRYDNLCVFFKVDKNLKETAKEAVTELHNNMPIIFETSMIELETTITIATEE